MIRHILFDLDGTLYSSRYGLENKVSQRVQEFITSLLKVDPEEGKGLRKEAMRKYGSTIEWLRTEKGFTAPEEYEAYIHPEGEADSLPPDPVLRRFIESLPCPCSILTNSPLFHAERILKKLEMEGLFQNIFDIRSNGHKGKPNASSYLKALDALKLTLEEVLFVDDLPLYVQGYLALGGKGLLLDENDIHKDYPGERIKTLQELTRFLD